MNTIMPPDLPGWHFRQVQRRSIRDSEQVLRGELQQRSLKGLGKQGVRDLLLGSVGVTTGAAVFHSLVSRDSVVFT
jgi:hypothetical protein